MLMTFEPERLVMTVDEAERESLRALRAADPRRFDTEETWHEMIVDDLILNDEFMEIPEGPTGDLTSAPMIGVCGSEEEKPDGYAENWVGSGLLNWGSGCVLPILYRWAFMDYAVETPQGALADTGRAVWMGGKLLDRGQPDVYGPPMEVFLRKEW